MAAIVRHDKYEEVWLTEESGALFESYCKSQPRIIASLAADRKLDIANSFDGDAEEAAELTRWIEGQIHPRERPLVTQTLSGTAIKSIGKLAPCIEPLGIRECNGVSAEELVRAIAAPGRHHLGQCYISVDPRSFGTVGYLVGWSSQSRVAAFVQEFHEGREYPDATTFGGFLERRIGALTTLDFLVPLNNS
jgi:hypothetical protein